MPTMEEHLLSHVMQRLRQVQLSLGVEPAGAGAGDARLGEQLDSMGLVELVALLADDCGVAAELIEDCVQHQFGTLRELAEAMAHAGLALRAASASPQAAVNDPMPRRRPALGWLGGVTLDLPREIQTAAMLDGMLGREPGWFLARTGIQQRRVWGAQDPMAEATATGLACLRNTGLLPEEVGALLVTSEAPPLLAGLAASLHHRLNLRPEAVALEVGGACTGFLAALWLARLMVPEVESILLLCVEAPSLHLHVEPGPAGEAAALFSDAAAACVVTRQPTDAARLPLFDVHLEAHGSAADCLQVRVNPAGRAEVRMDGPRLASHAIDALADLLRHMAARHALPFDDMPALLVHGGNGRLPVLLARRLHLPEDRVWSQTALTGNLGSASLPAAWAAHRDQLRGPVLWAAVGAGLTGAAALTGMRTQESGSSLLDL